MLRCPAPVVASPDDCDRLLGHLTLIGSIERDHAAELDRQVQGLKDRIKAEQLVEVGAETRTFAEFRDAAVEAIRGYASTPEGRKELLAGVTGKTRKFTHGTVGFRKLAPTLVDVDGKPATTKTRILVAAKDLGKSGLVAAVVGWLKQFKLGEKIDVTVDQIVAVKVEPDRRAILALVRDGQLKPSWLKRFNLKVEDGGEAIDVEPAEQLVRSESTKAA